MHDRAFRVLQIVETVQVQHGVDDAKGGFAVWGVIVGEGIGGDGCRAEEDFAVRESDDIGGGGVEKKFVVDPGDHGIRDDRKLDAFEGGQEGGFFAGNF